MKAFFEEIDCESGRKDETGTFCDMGSANILDQGCYCDREGCPLIDDDFMKEN
jgi:hypothetical protein